MAVHKHDPDMSDESDFDFDEEYFERSYRPLSNLPTPPPSSRNSSASHSPQPSIDDGETLDPTFLGPAIHLVNLIPPSASLAAPSVPLVHAILTRANLPLDVIALAVCILDSLDAKFSLKWRLACPLNAPALSSREAGSGSTTNKRHTVGPGPLMGILAGGRQQQLHIDCVPPELIILAALVIAVKFTADLHEPMQHYASGWGRGLWSCVQINASERCIMGSLGYRILPLWDRDVIAGALADMQRAARLPQQQPLTVLPPRRCGGGHLRAEENAHLRSMSSGVAVTGLGLQLTPIQTPKPAGDLCGPTGQLGEDVRAAFEGAAGMSPDALHLPAEGRRTGFTRIDGVVEQTTVV